MPRVEIEDWFRGTLVHIITIHHILERIQNDAIGKGSQEELNSTNLNGKGVTAADFNHS